MEPKTRGLSERSEACASERSEGVWNPNPGVFPSYSYPKRGFLSDSAGTAHNIEDYSSPPPPCARIKKKKKKKIGAEGT